MALLNKKQDESPRRRQRDDTPRTEAPASYMRNRTIGANYRLQSEQESERSRAHQLSAHRRKVGGVFLIVLAAIGLLGFILLQLTTQVSILGQNSSMSRKLDTQLYSNAINGYFDRHPIERLRFMLNEDQLSAYMAQVYPEVGSVKQITNWGIGKTQYELSVRNPIAGWVINNSQYYVDAEGIAFENNYYANPTVQIIDESGAQPTSGTTVTSTRFLGFIGRVVAIGKERGYTVTEAKLPLGTTREADIRIEGINSFVKLSIDRGAGEQMEDLARTLNYLTTKAITPTYIDLRVAGRAYYQ